MGDKVTKEQARQLTAFLDKNESILKNIDEGIVIFDLDGKAVAANPAAACLFGQPVREVIGSDMGTLLGEEVKIDRERILNLRRDDKALLVALVLVCGPSGQTICTVAVFHDLAQEADMARVRDDFVSLASHELRTPLGAVLGYVDMLREDVYGPLTKQQSEVVDRVAANAEQLASLVNSLLDEAQMQAGGLTLNRVPFAPIKLIDNVQIVMARAAQYKGLNLTACIADDVPAMLYGDFQRLCQVLSNLVGNAIGLAKSGIVHVEVYRPDEDHWALEVSDTGSSISEETQSYAFAPFRQVGVSIRRGRRGAEPGLSIVRRLVALMNGKIVEGRAGHRNIFTVILPLALRDTDALCEGMEEPISVQDGTR
jgi:signal transduction histidine kinase